MAEKEFEQDDPYELVGMRIPMDPGVNKDEVMARCFIEEYALMGMPREKLPHLFHSPAFAGAHAIWQALGDAAVQRIVDDVFGPRPQEVV